MPVSMQISYPTSVSKCIKIYPEALSKADSEGNLPLHKILWYEASTIDDTLRMIEKHPAALQHQNAVGQLPLHIECSCKRRSSIISKCIELHPQALEIADNTGLLPLHMLLVYGQPSVDLALLLIEKCPASLKHPAVIESTQSVGILPIYTECHNQCRPTIISKCLELYPESLDEKVVYLIMNKVNESNFRRFSSVLSTVFTHSPLSLYHLHNGNDVRRVPYYRRRILSMIPRHKLTAIHVVDFEDLNWKPRAAMAMLLSKIKIQHQESRLQGSNAARLIESLLA
jgi:hypothetical protein